MTEPYHGVMHDFVISIYHLDYQEILLAPIITEDIV